jgi:hypothetical protein
MRTISALLVGVLAFPAAAAADQLGTVVDASQRDRSCAMRRWGKAMTLYDGDAAAFYANQVKLRESVRVERAHGASNREMPISQLEAEARVAFAEGDGDKEMLADMLFEMKRPADALGACQAVLEASPNRFDALGVAAQARQYYTQFVAIAAPTPIGLKSRAG